MTRSIIRLGAAGLFVLAVTTFVTWPQAIRMTTGVAVHNDPHFSAWRMAWIAHALVTSPLHLFDANIFYPSRLTLAYSDAMMLEGVLAAPLFWAGVPQILIYNIVLFIGFVGSGLAMFVLARYVIGATGPALVAAAVFTMAPYRIEHFMHLELQWSMWVPLTFWAIHRAVDEGSRRFGILAGLFVWLQILSCVHYGVFLAMTLVVFVPLLFAFNGPRAARALPGLVLGGLLAAILTAPYALPYLRAAETLGRGAAEIARYSAHPWNYFAASFDSRLWGWTAERWGDSELRLFPGLVAIVLAIIALVRRPRWTFFYAIVAALTIEMSFGINGTIYRWLSTHVNALHGLRSVSRFSMIALCAVAMMAGLGASAMSTLTHRRVLQWAIVPVLLLLMMVDYSNRPMPLTSRSLAPPETVYRVIHGAGPGVIIDLPLPDLQKLPGWDAIYTAWSTDHWHPLINGYSGYHPLDYLETVFRMSSFPDDVSIARLKDHDVRYIVVHRNFYDEDQYASLLLKMATRPELRPWGTYRDPVGSAELFVIER